MSLRAQVNRYVLKSRTPLPYITETEFQLKRKGEALADMIDQYDRDATLALMITEELNVSSSTTMMAKALVITIRAQINPMYSHTAQSDMWQRIRDDRNAMYFEQKQPMSHDDSVRISIKSNTMQQEHSVIIRNIAHWLLKRRACSMFPPIKDHFIHLVDGMYTINENWKSSTELSWFLDMILDNKQWFEFAWSCEDRWQLEEHRTNCAWQAHLRKLKRYSTDERTRRAHKWLKNLSCSRWTPPASMPSEYKEFNDEQHYRWTCRLNALITVWWNALD